MDYNKSAEEILRYIGGTSNINSVEHCFTRLRFSLVDTSKADQEKIEKVEGVIQVVDSGGQYQVVIGSKVEKVYEALAPKLEKKDIKQTESQGKKINDVLQFVAKVFTPLVPAIAAAGLIKGLLTAARLIFQKYGIDISGHDTYVILYAASQVIFYFMPVFLAYTVARAMKCNVVIAMVIGAFLVYPTIDALIQDTSVATTIFGLPVTKGIWQVGDSAKVFSYSESVIPAILSTLVLAYLERFLKKYIPSILQIILVPGLSLIVMIPATLVVFGPIGIVVGNAIQIAYSSVMGFNQTFGGALIGGLWGVAVMFGAHRALLPIGLNDVAVTGRQNLLAFAGAANFSQGGAALGVMLKSKDKALKGIAASASISATLVGITEPAIYGCNLRLKKPMIAAIVSGAIGGGIMGYGDVYGDAFANNGLLTIFTYAGFGIPKFIYYLVGCAVAFFGAALLTYILGFEELNEFAPESVSEKQAKSNPTRKIEQLSIQSPIEGTIIPLSEVKDEVFAKEVMGKGVGIIPSRGEVFAPEDAEVIALFPTGHAIGLRLDNNVELLIHIGIDTVKLQGQFFEKIVQQGQKVAKGDLLIRFDKDKIEAAGYDTTVPVVISAMGPFQKIKDQTGQEANTDTPIMILS